MLERPIASLVSDSAEELSPYLGSSLCGGEGLFVCYLGAHFGHEGHVVRVLVETLIA